MTIRVGVGVVCAALLLVPLGATGQVASCDRCHGELELLRQHVETLELARRLFVPSDTVVGSAHAALPCAECHTGVARWPHDAVRRTTSCESCHEDATAAWSTGAHAAPEAGDAGATCTSCHGVHRVDAAGSAESREHVSVACSGCHALSVLPAWDAHADTVECVSCHLPHALDLLDSPDSRLAPAHQYETCGACHEDQAVVTTDAHGTALTALDPPPGLSSLDHISDAPPTCSSCHGGHGVVAADDDRFETEMVERCTACHETASESYFGTYHGKATALGSEIVATCDACHGSHQVFPAGDPRSSVSEANVVETCAACHEHSRPAFVAYDAHPDPTDRSRNAPLFYSFVFMNSLLFGVLGLFALHTLLWWVRLTIDRHREQEVSRG